MRQRLDIADVEERTKIRAKYLRALENEEWGLLPGPTFVRTFLRTYAEVVGVDPHLLVEEYRKTAMASEEADYQGLAPMPRERRRGGGPRQQRRSSLPGPPRRGAVLGVVAVALVAFLLALGLLGGDDEPDEAADRSPTPAADGDRRQERPDAERPEPAEPRQQPRRVVVRVEPTAPTYVCVDNGPDTDVVFQDTIESAQTFRHPRLVRLNLGVRSATVTRNGDPVEFEDSAEPLGLALRRGGVRDISEGERPCA